MASKSLTPPHTHTPTQPHTHSLESKESKNNTLECKENYQKSKISNQKNVNKSKNRLTPTKLESKKQDKKVLASREGSGGQFPTNVKKKPRPILYFK